MIGIVRVARAVALASCIFAFVVPCFAQTHPAAEVYGQLPSVSEPSLSPDGMHMATIQSYKGRPVALIYDLSVPLGSKLPVIIPYTDGFISYVHWAKNQRLLIRIDMNQAILGDKVNRWSRTVSVDTEGKTPAVMFRDFSSTDYNYSASTVADYDLDDPDHIHMPLWYVDPFDGSNRYSLYKVDVNDGRQTLQERGSSKTDEYFMDGHGHVVARIDQETDPLIDHLLIYKDDDWKEVAKFPADNGNGADIEGVSLDGTALVQVVSSDKAGTTGLVTRKLSDNTVSDLFFDSKYDIDSALIDPWTKRIIGVAVTADMAQDRYFDPAMEFLAKGAGRSVSGRLGPCGVVGSVAAKSDC